MCAIEDSPRLETRRLLLRAPEPCDVGRIAELAADWDVVRMTGRMPHPYGLDDAERFVADAIAHDPRRDNAFLIEVEREGVVGMLSFFHFRLAQSIAASSASVAKPRPQKGLPTQ